jgi:DNA-binding FrmR family transcriptional regulator
MSSGCAGSKGRYAASSGWSRTTSTASTSVAIGLLEEHLGHCVVEAVAEGGDTATDKIREASDAIARLVRS